MYSYINYKQKESVFFHVKLLEAIKQKLNTLRKEFYEEYKISCLVSI